MGAFLAVNAHPNTTSPTHRGLFIRERLLCQVIPPPPPDANDTLPPPDPRRPQSVRQRLEQHRATPACAGCHALMDPIGLAFEQFDAIGSYRTTDSGLPIDPSGELDGRGYRDARALGALLRAHPDLAPCLARQAYRHAVVHLEQPGETVALQRLAEQFQAAGYRFRELMLALVTNDGFRTVGVAP
jgi:hypothetical protein